MDALTVKRAWTASHASNEPLTFVGDQSAIERYLEHEEWFVGAVKQGPKQA